MAKIQFYRGPSSALPVLEDGQPGFTTDTHTLYVGMDGTNHAVGGGAPSGPAGGVLSGTYPDPGFAEDMATQAELDTAITDHEASSNPHPQYLTAAEGDAAYASLSHNHDATYAALSHNHSAADITSGTLALARGGTGASLADPNADRILFWDDSAGAVAWLTVGADNSGLVVSGTSLSAATADEVTPGVLPTATQADMENAAEIVMIVTPGRTGFHPGVAKGWIDFTGTGTIAINASRNVSSITDNGAGDYTVTWNTDFSSADYCVICGGQYVEDDAAGGAARGTEVARTTNAKVAGSVRVRTVEYFGTFDAVDFRRVYVAAFGDQ